MGSRLLFVSKGTDSSSTRYRALQFFPHWQAAGYAPAHVTASGGLAATLAMLRAARHADIVVVLRKTFPALLLRLLRLCSRKLVFDFDDAIFCNTDGSPSPTRMARFLAMTKSCDAVFAGNAYLAATAAATHPATTVIPTCVDVARYAVAAAPPDATLDLVWIGSGSTRKYLLDAMPWLAAAAKLLPGLRLKIIADFDLPGYGIPTVALPWSAATEAQDLASAHIGIAPMRDDDWSRGKCALKILQYMAAGLPVVSSQAGANAEAVAHEVTGLLAANPQEWVAHITRLARDAGLRRAMGEAGRRRVAEHFSLEVVFAHMRNRIDGLRGSGC
jgi:glycosyltransferase involved in cell wall biosynthesis